MGSPSANEELGIEEQARMQINFAVEVLKQAERAPQSIAIHSVERGDLSYGWLSREARRCGNVLRRLGLKRGDRYLCSLPSILETAVAFLGGQLIGAVPVMVFPGYRDREMEHVLAASNASLAITTVQHSKRLQTLGPRVSQAAVLAVYEGIGELPSLRRLMAEASDELDPVQTDGDEIAEILFTSGTTGNPKGIPHTHISVVTRGRCTTATTWRGLGPGDVTYTPGPISFAMGMHCHVHLCFITGAASLYCAERPSPQRFLELVDEYSVTHIMTSATHLWNVLSVLPQPERLRSVKSIIVGGSALTSDLFEEWYGAYGIVLQPSFAMTEILAASHGTQIGEGRPDTMGMLLPEWEARRQASSG